MKLEEAIKHCEEQAAKYERQCEYGVSKEGKEYNSQCASEQRQLAEKTAQTAVWAAIAPAETMQSINQALENNRAKINAQNAETDFCKAVKQRVAKMHDKRRDK